MQEHALSDAPSHGTALDVTHQGEPVQQEDDLRAPGPAGTAATSDAAGTVVHYRPARNPEADRPATVEPLTRESDSARWQGVSSAILSPATGDEGAKAKRYPTNEELHAIRQVRPITADDLGPGPHPGGNTLEKELEFQNYVPKPIIITEEERRQLAVEAKKYLEWRRTEFGEPSPEELEFQRWFWADAFEDEHAEDSE